MAWGTSHITHSEGLDPKRCMTLLRPYVARHVQRDDIEDVLQETLLRLHQRQSDISVQNERLMLFRRCAVCWRIGGGVQQSGTAIPIPNWMKCTTLLIR